MDTFNGEIFGDNIRRFIEASGLTQDEVANVLDIAKETLRNIIDNKVEPGGPTVINLLDFFGLDKDATKHLVPITDFFREKLKKRYAKNIRIRPLFFKEPTVPFALEYYLIPSGELSTPKDIGQIKDFFAKYDWGFTTSQISDAIGRNKIRLGIKTRNKADSKVGYEYYL